MKKIRKYVVMRNKAFHLLFTFFMNKVSEYDTRQLLQELTLGRMNYKEILIREIKKDIRPINEPAPKLYGRRNNIFTKRRKTAKEDLRNIDLIAYIFSNIKGFVEYKYIRRLTHDDIKNMARFIRYEFYPKDSYIFRQGDKSNKFYGIINGDVQIVETKFTDKLKHLKELLIKIDEREKISEEDKIFFLSGKNYNINNEQNNYYSNNNFDNHNNNNYKYVDDDVSIKTKKYFVSKMSNSEENNNDNYFNLMNYDSSSISSLSDNLNHIDVYKLKKRSSSDYFNNNKNGKISYYKNKRILKFLLESNFSKRLTIKNNFNKKRHSDRHLNRIELVSKLVYKSIKNKRKKEKESNIITISENERDNIDFLNKNLMNFGKILSEGSCFGDQEMSKKKKRNYSLICLTDCHLFSLKKEYFDKIMLSKIIRSELIKTNFILDRLNVISKEQHFFKLITKIIPKLYYKGQILYTPFDIADNLYLVYKGECAMCETVKIYDNKNDFLAEKPEMKIISILNEGGIGGLEAYQKNVNYEKYLIVNSSLTIILKIDIKDFDQYNYRFRRSLEPLYFQQQRMIFSIQRKGLFFKIGREINKNDEAKIKLKNDIQQSTKFIDKNKFSIKIHKKMKNKDKINNNIKNNLFKKSNLNKSLIPLKTINVTKNIINNYTVSNETKVYSPIKLLIKQKKLEIEDTTSVLTSFIKDIKNNKFNNSQNSNIINTNLKDCEESIYRNRNKTLTNNTIFKQKKYYSFYHQKFRNNPISLKGYFSQENNDSKQINKFQDIKNNIFSIRATLNNNIFNFYKQIGNDLKINKNKIEKKYSWDKVNIFHEETFKEIDRKKSNKLNIYSSIKSRKSFKLKRNPKMLNNVNKSRINLYSTFKIKKLPSISNNS